MMRGCKWAVGTTVVVGLACTLTARADLVWFEWEVSDGGNGHQYALTTSNTTWELAETEAVAEDGHLVTINDQDEQNWLNATFPAGEPFHPWIGFWQDPDDPDYSEPGGGWKWISGETSTYTNWAGGEPNEAPPSGTNEDRAQMHAFGPGLWQDVPGAADYAFQRGIIEVVPDVIPAPGAALLAMIGLPLIGWAKRRCS